jgi:cell division initiation protein
MTMTPLDIRQGQFRIRFRGFDLREVDAFLERVAEAMEALILENQTLRTDMERLQDKIRGFQDQEKTFQKAMVNAQEMLNAMKQNAEKETDLIISEAQMKAEKILSSADNRLYRLHNDISELKRQRMQLEVDLRTILEAHTKLLDMSREAMESEEKADEKLRFLKNS